MMWPFKKSRPRQPRESELAAEAARENLRQSLQDRREVESVSRLARRELEANHISKRINLLLKEGR